MANSRLTMGNFGASTRPLQSAPQVKSNKERLLKRFREKLGRKGYSPAEAANMAVAVRSQANALAVEMNARQGNDDPVRMGNIHTLALKLKISDALKKAPSKLKKQPQQRISRTSPMGVAVSAAKNPKTSNSRTMVTALADRGKSLSYDSIRKRGDKRRQKKEAQIYQMEKYRKARGKLKNDILEEAKRASYMQQFNGAMGHYYGGTMGKKNIFKKAASKVKQAAKYTAASASRAAQIAKKDPIGAIAKVTIAAPFTVVASVAPKNTVVGKLARKAESGTVDVVKKGVELAKKGLNAIGDAIKKVWEKIKALISKLLAPIKAGFKKAWDGLKRVIVEKVAARFTGKGTAGFGSLPEDEKNKLTELAGKFVEKKALEAVGTEVTIYGAAFLATEKSAMVGAEAGAAKAAAAAAAAGPIVAAGAAVAGATTGGTAAATTAAAASSTAATTATATYVTNLTKDGVNDVGTEFAKYKAKKAVPNPIAQKVLGAALDGKIPTNPEAVKEMATALPAQAQQKFIQEVQRAPESAKQEIIKKAFVPQDFKKAVDFLPKEASAIGASKPAIPQVAVADMMQKQLAKNPNVIAPKPEEAKAIAAQGVAVQDQAAVEAVQQGKMNMTEGIVASSKIGKEAAISKLPPEARPAAVAAVKDQMSNAEVARIDDKAKEEKEKKGSALLVAAGIAAKVLLF